MVKAKATGADESRFKPFTREWNLDPKTGEMDRTPAGAKPLMQKAIEPIGGPAFSLTKTPLLLPLKMGQSIVIFFDADWVLRSHVKTAVLRNGRFPITVSYLTPTESMAHLAGATEHEYRRDMEDSDLFVLHTDGFPKFPKAYHFHEMLFSSRSIRQKPSWFAVRRLPGETDPLLKITTGEAATVDPSFINRLGRMHKVPEEKDGKSTTKTISIILTEAATRKTLTPYSQKLLKEQVGLEAKLKAELGSIL